MNRQCAKTLLKSLDKYDDLKKMVSRAVDPVKPSLVKSHPKNRENLDEAFIDLCHSWRSFKRDLNVIEEEFNGEEDTGEPKYEYNDKWFEDAQEGYYEIIEKSDEILAAKAAPSVPNEEVEDKSARKLLLNRRRN